MFVSYNKKKFSPEPLFLKTLANSSFRYAWSTLKIQLEKFSRLFSAKHFFFNNAILNTAGAVAAIDAVDDCAVSRIFLNILEDFVQHKLTDFQLHIQNNAIKCRFLYSW